MLRLFLEMQDGSPIKVESVVQLTVEGLGSIVRAQLANGDERSYTNVLRVRAESQ